MKKTFFRQIRWIAACLLAVTLVCGVLSCDNDSGKDDNDVVYTLGGTNGTGSSGGGSTHSSSGSTAANVRIMKECYEVGDILLTLGAGDDSVLKSFKPSATPPAAGVTTKKLSIDQSPVDVLAWLDGNTNTIWYYASGYTDSSRQIPLYVCGGSTNAMFKNCKALQSIDLTGFDSSSVGEFELMFSGCSSLTSLNLSKFNMGSSSGTWGMTSMFEGCSSLTSLDVSKFNTSKVRYMDAMFKNCSSLTSLDLSKFDTSKVELMSSMFEGCSSLTSLDVSKFNTSKVRYMDAMFKNCSSLTSLDVSKFDTSKVENMESMFWGCSSLTSLDLSNFDTSEVLSYDRFSGMFYSCSNLTTIYASSRFVVNNNPGTSMFFDCSSLVGGAGTAYDSWHIGADYAHIDGGTSNPGYFTAKP